ncbi:MAG: AraC family transcriptional regulator [Verrucomicrobiales bacterium]|nr:AraC family transcriptional regulator [Verrucomicrobiales bacterium]
MSFSTTALPDLIREDGSLAVSAEVLGALFDEVDDVAFFIKDHEGRYLVANRSLAERHGFSDQKDLLGKKPSDLCPGLFGEVPTDQDQQVLKTGEPIRNHLEMQWLRPHRPCWCLTTKLPLRDEGGEVVGLVGFSSDLRERFPVKAIPEKVAVILGEFERNPGEPVSPAELASRAGMTTVQFSRLLKKVFGVTPSQHITRTRVQLAAELLNQSQSSVAEVALECGYCDHSAFTRAFRATMGMTPSQYRESEASG